MHCEHERIVYLTESHTIQRNQSYCGETSFPTKDKLEFSEFTTKNGGFTIKTDIDFLERLCLSIDQFKEVAN